MHRQSGSIPRRKIAARGQREQFGDCLQVLVGRLRVDVAEPGGQQRQPGPDVAAITVEVQQAGDGMGEVVLVQPGAVGPGSYRQAVAACSRATSPAGSAGACSRATPDSALAACTHSTVRSRFISAIRCTNSK